MISLHHTPEEVVLLSALTLRTQLDFHLRPDVKRKLQFTWLKKTVFLPHEVTCEILCYGKLMLSSPGLSHLHLTIKNFFSITTKPMRSLRGNPGQGTAVADGAIVRHG